MGGGRGRVWRKGNRLCCKGEGRKINGQEGKVKVKNEDKTVSCEMLIEKVEDENAYA